METVSPLRWKPRRARARGLPSPRAAGPDWRSGAGRRGPGWRRAEARRTRPLEGGAVPLRSGEIDWRRRADSNRRIEVLQTSALVHLATSPWFFINQCRRVGAEGGI